MDGEDRPLLPSTEEKGNQGYDGQNIEELRATVQPAFILRSSLSLAVG
jgi:hypothetical protein